MAGLGLFRLDWELVGFFHWPFTVRLRAYVSNDAMLDASPPLVKQVCMHLVAHAKELANQHNHLFYQ